MILTITDRHAQKQTTQNNKPTVKTKASKLQTRNGTPFLTLHIVFAVVQRPTCWKNSKPQHTYTKRNQMFKRYRKASQSPIPSWATNQQVLIIFFCAFRNKGDGAPAISDLVQSENNGTGYWIVNMSDSYFGRQQYVIYCILLSASVTI